MATLEQLERALVGAHEAGDTAAAQTLAAEIKKMRGPAQVAQEQPQAQPQPQQPSVRDIIPSVLGGKYLPDLVMGGRQLWDAAAQLAARGAEKAIGGETLTKMREDTERVNAEALKDYQQKFNPDAVPGASVARGVGQALAAAPFVPAIGTTGVMSSALAGAGVGGVSGALTPDYDPDKNFWGRKGENIAMGAAFGGLLGGAGGALGKIGPTKEAKALMDANVRVPVGRAAGGGAQRLEEGLESVPILGDAVRGASRRAVEDFNRATIDKALAPIGEKLSPKTIGREAIKEARIKIGRAYESTLDKIGRVDLDKQFSDEGTKVAQMTAELGEQAQKQFLNVLKNRVFDKITPAGTMSATTMKQVDSDLGRIASGFLKSQDQNQRGLGLALFEVQASLRRNVERSAGPELAAQMKAANEAWATWVRVADASSRAGSKEGVFSPAALRGAVQKGDKRAFREGDALLQKWAEGAESVLGPKVPDSGSPFRLLGTAGLGYFFDPSVAATGATMALPYMFPRAATAIADKAAGAGAIAPYLGLFGPGLSERLSR